MRRSSILPAVMLLASLLAGCDMLGIETPEKVAQQKEAEGKAVGAACRHASRAIEDCFALNKKADKAAVFAGWKEMNDYMRENKIDPVTPQGLPTVAAAPAVVEAQAEEPAARPEKADKGGRKQGGKHS